MFLFSRRRELGARKVVMSSNNATCMDENFTAADTYDVTR